MNATELYLRDGGSAGVWYCEKCHHVHGHRALAEECCKPRVCACGSECDNGWAVCNKCRVKIEAAKERERFDKAEKVTEWDGPVYHPTLDIYARNISEMLETLPESDRPKPEYVWTCRNVPVCMLDADAVVVDAMESAPEEFARVDVNGLTELRKAIDDFNNANRRLVYWEVDYTKAMVLGEVRWRRGPA